VIQVIGDPDTREYDAALVLRDHIARLWPAAVNNPVHDVRIIAGAKCHGQYPRDIDLFLLANLGPGLTYDTFLPFARGDNQLQTSGMIEVRSLCVAIEVKDHPPEAVQFVGTHVQVHYRDGWKNATEQNFRQAHSVRNYLGNHGIPPPFVVSLLWMRNVPVTDLPPRPHSIVGTPVTWELLLNVIAQDRTPRFSEGRWVLDSGITATSLSRAADLFSRKIVPTRLDRLRMERVIQRTADLTSIREAVGCRLLILRGRGGTGKTMRLLQLANRLSDEEDARVLILTYNRALVADIRRLLTILGIRDDLDGGTIHIQTVHSFLYAVLDGLELISGAERTFLTSYERLKDEALAYLEGGAISADDLDRLALVQPTTFGWDYVFVDEGQDWPDNERDLLLRFYGHKRVVVADGIDQLVRSPIPAFWRAGRTRSEVSIVTLTASLRMKAGLARFVSATARHLGLLTTEWEPSEQLPGGRVIVLEGNYLQERALHDRLLGENAADGNWPIDMLFCVPPRFSTQTSQCRATPAASAAVFTGWGFPVWDGTRDDVRDSYPTEVNQLRIVQYESCRGLEGWTVVNLGLDRFYEVKLAMAESRVLPDSSGELPIDPLRAQREAARWVLIPLTRAMDTILIQLDCGESPLRAALQAATAECSENVEWFERR
jgi:hypothetical protein